MGKKENHPLKLKFWTLKLLTDKQSESFSFYRIEKESKVSRAFCRNNNLENLDKLVEFLFEDSELATAEKFKLWELLPPFERPLEDFLWALMYLTTGWLYAPRNAEERTQDSVKDFLWERNHSFWAVLPCLSNAYFLDRLRPAVLTNLTHLVRNRIHHEGIKSPEVKTKMIFLILIGMIQIFYGTLPTSVDLEKIIDKKTPQTIAKSSEDKESPEEKLAFVISQNLFNVYREAGKTIRKILGKKKCKLIVKAKQQRFIQECIFEALRRGAFIHSLDGAAIAIPEKWNYQD